MLLHYKRAATSWCAISGHAPEPRTVARRATARAREAPRGRETLVHVDPATRMRSRVFGGVDADARQEAAEIVGSSGEDRHLRHVPLLLRPGEAELSGPRAGERGRGAVGDFRHRDPAPPLADLNDQRQVRHGRDVRQGEAAIAPGERRGGVVADRGRAGRADVRPGREGRQGGPVVGDVDGDVGEGVLSRRVEDGTLQRRGRSGGAGRVDVAPQRQAGVARAAPRQRATAARSDDSAAAVARPHPVVFAGRRSVVGDRDRPVGTTVARGTGEVRPAAALNRASGHRNRHDGDERSRMYTTGHRQARPPG